MIGKKSHCTECAEIDNNPNSLIAVLLTNKEQINVTVPVLSVLCL